jgi:hypothetical protein
MQPARTQLCCAIIAGAPSACKPCAQHARDMPCCPAQMRMGTQGRRVACLLSPPEVLTELVTTVFLFRFELRFVPGDGAKEKPSLPK